MPVAGSVNVIAVVHFKIIPLSPHHYIELSFILRKYLSERFGIHLLEKTTIEAQLILKQYGLSEKLLSEIGIILNGSDMVKFAKSAPEEKIIRANLDDCRNIVEQTADEALPHV